jgi:hypothetical protein
MRGHGVKSEAEIDDLFNRARAVCELTFSGISSSMFHEQPAKLT